MTTEQEKKVLNLLSDAHNEFRTLGEYHPADTVEWIHHLHALQNIVMSRGAVRDEPEFFTKVPTE